MGKFHKQIKKEFGDSTCSDNRDFRNDVLEMLATAKREFPKREGFQHEPLEFESIDGPFYAREVTKWFVKWFGNGKDESR